MIQIHKDQVDLTIEVIQKHARQNSLKAALHAQTRVLQRLSLIEDSAGGVSASQLQARNAQLDARAVYDFLTDLIDDA